MRKYYNVEIAYNTRIMIDRVNNFRTWLYDNNIKHEISAAGDFVHFVHFEILLSKEEVEQLFTSSDDQASEKIDFAAILKQKTIKLQNKRKK